MPPDHGGLIGKFQIVPIWFYPRSKYKIVFLVGTTVPQFSRRETVSKYSHENQILINLCKYNVQENLCLIVYSTR